MTSYIWGGADGAQVGRHGPLATGAIVSLTDEEVLSVAGNSNWAPKPSIQDKKMLVLSADTTLTNAQSGVVVLNVKTSAAAFTLPESPTVGVNFDFQFGPGAVGDITVNRNGKTIDGAASNLTLAIASVLRTGVYYNGSGWVTYTT